MTMNTKPPRLPGQPFPTGPKMSPTPPSLGPTHRRTADEERILAVVMHMPFLTTRNLPLHPAGQPITLAWVAEVMEAIGEEVSGVMRQVTGIEDELNTVKRDLKAMGRLMYYASTAIARYPERKDD